MFTITLQPKDMTGCQPDVYAEYSAIENIVSRWDDTQFRAANGKALLGFIENKVDFAAPVEKLAYSSLATAVLSIVDPVRLVEDKPEKPQATYNFGLLSGLVTAASITPLREKDTQIAIAEKVARVLDTISPESSREFQEIKFDEFYQQCNQEAERINYIALYTAQWTNTQFIIDANTVERLEASFAHTPAYEVCKIFQDNRLIDPDMATATAQKFVTDCKLA